MSLKAKQIFGLGGKTPGEARVVQWYFTKLVKHDNISDENCITVSMPRSGLSTATLRFQDLGALFAKQGLICFLKLLQSYVKLATV